VKGTAAVKIRDIRTILTAPNKIRLVVVKVETTEPGLVGWGCATFTQRALVVETAIEKYLKPFLIGRERGRDRGHLAVHVRELVLAQRARAVQRDERRRHRALGHQGQARGDAALPAPRGKVRKGADCYFHASGSSFQEVEENARAAMEKGFRHVRVQVATPGYASYGARSAWPDAGPADGVPARSDAVGPTNPGHLGAGPYVRMLPKLFEHMRTKLGDEVELLHDVHERVTLNQAINLCKALEPYRLFFLEDPFPPEENDHFRLLRQQTSIPIAMGELFNTQHEYVPLIKDRLIDFIRIHISQIGGLSPRARCRRCASTSASAPRGTARATPHPWPTPPSSRWSWPATTSGSTRERLPEGRRPRCSRAARGQGRLHAGRREAGARDRLRREAGREVPHRGRTAELRLFLGHDATTRRDGDQALKDARKAEHVGHEVDGRARRVRHAV
jgi:mannonate dehydratase